MMPALLAGLSIDPAILLWKSPLPAPFGLGMRVFSPQGVGQSHLTIAVGEVLFPDVPDPEEMFLQMLAKRFRQHGDAGLGPLAVPNRDLITGKIQILNPQTQTLHQPQPNAVHQAGHEPFVAIQVSQHGFDLAARHDHRKTAGLAGSDDFSEVSDLTSQNVPVQKQDGAEGLRLCRGTDMLFDGQMRQELVDLLLAHFCRMAFSVEEDESPDPGHIGLFRSSAVVPRAQSISHSFQEIQLMGMRESVVEAAPYHRCITRV